MTYLHFFQARLLMRAAIIFLLLALFSHSRVTSAAEAITVSAKSEQPVIAIPPRQAFFILDAACRQCDTLLAELEQPGREFQQMRQNGWKIGPELDAHIRILNKSEAEALLGSAITMRLPTVVGVEFGKVVRSFQSGCSTPLDMWTFHWLVTGKDQRPVPARIQPVTVATTGNYPLRGNHWSVDGDWHPSHQKMLHHLRGAAHAHQIRAEWTLEVWTLEELRSLHDNLHELEAYGQTTVYSSQENARHYRPVSFSNSSANPKNQNFR